MRNVRRKQLTELRTKTILRTKNTRQGKKIIIIIRMNNNFKKKQKKTSQIYVHLISITQQKNPTQFRGS